MLIELDFTLNRYIKLIKTCLEYSYTIQSFQSYINNAEKKMVILRHDVDRYPKRALKMAKLEAELGKMEKEKDRLDNSIGDIDRIKEKTGINNRFISGKKESVIEIKYARRIKHILYTVYTRMVR